MTSLQFFVLCAVLVCGTKAIDVSSILKRIEDVGYKVSSTVAQLQANKEALEYLHDEFKVKSEEIIRADHRQERAAVPVVGFTARLSHSIAHVQDVVFQNTVVNRHNSYNVTTGRFTCPVTGLYQFASTIASASEKTISCELVMDNVQLARFHANGPGLDQSSHVVVISCNQGQQVWVRHENSEHDDAILPPAPYTSFAGHLVAVS